MRGISTVLILSPASSDLGMATVLEGDVKKNLLERTEAEKVFRPWWDTLEDYLLNSLVLLGEWRSVFRIVSHIKYHPNLENLM